MNIEDFLELIHDISEKNIYFTFHFNERSRERNLNKKLIIDTLLNKKVLDIHSQSKNIFKLWFEFNDNYDLIIIISPNLIKCMIITVFIENNKKRLRK